MLVLALLACVPKDAPPAPPAPHDAVVLPPPAPSSATAPPCPDLAPALWARVADPTPVAVVVVGSWAPPAWWAPDDQVDSRAQGSVPGARLCELAGLPGVEAVEAVQLASPKDGPYPSEAP